MTFAAPLALLLLLVPAALLLLDVRRRRELQTRLLLPSTEAYVGVRPTMRARLVRLPRYLAYAAAALLIVCLARPQTDAPLLPDEREGIDILLAIDISQSMLTPDLTPNRLEAAKRIAADFIAARPDDNIGLTLFGGDAYTLCPPTTDHASLLALLSRVSTAPVARGQISTGTAIGMGLATATAHLADAASPSRVVILLTDGENNTGAISPLSAADVAAERGVRVYTISAGSNTKTASSRSLETEWNGLRSDSLSAADADILYKIAQRTSGRYFRATTADDLAAVYDDIDRLEKRRLTAQTNAVRYEAYQPFALAALLLLTLAAILKLTWLRRWP